MTILAAVSADGALAQILQVAGALLILTAFVLAQAGRLRTSARTYLWLNLVGSAVLAVLAALGSNWGFLLLEGAWSLVSAWSLLTARDRRGRGAASASAATGGR